jgi:hypothetical protein
MATPLVLRDVHVPPAPPWWPPAPGWWLLLAVVLAALAGGWLRGRGGRRRRRDALALFDREIAGATSPAQRLAAASALLRRAARRTRADADRLQGGAWLEFLDAGDGAFVEGDGRLLLDGPFRADVEPGEAGRALALARRRFADLAGRR